MLNPMLNLVKIMHAKFGINCEKIAFSKEEKEFRIVAMREEVTEYEDALYKNREKELDALIDLVVFALGTAERQGWLEVFEEGFNRVMTANIAKEVGKNKSRGDFALDLVKPEGWVPADLSDLVANESMSQMSLFDYIHNTKK